MRTAILIDLMGACQANYRLVVANDADEILWALLVDQIICLQNFTESRQAVALAVVAFLTGDHHVTFEVKALGAREKMITRTFGTIEVHFLVAVETPTLLSVKCSLCADAF